MDIPVPPLGEQKKIVQKHLGHEHKPTEKFNEMMEKASTARGSNAEAAGWGGRGHWAGRAQGGVEGRQEGERDAQPGIHGVW